jgi:hypothetical protein
MAGNWESDSVEYRFMGDFYKFAKEFYNVEPENKEYWKRLSDTATALCNKYENTDFVVNVVTGYLNYANEVFKKYKIANEKAEITGQTSLL